MDIWMIALLVCAAIAGNVILVTVFRKAGQREARLSEFAQSQGWQFSKQTASGRQAGYMRISGADWQVTLHSGGDGPNKRFTEWLDPTLAAPAGLAVYMPPMPDKTQAMFNALMDKSGGMGRVVLNSFVAALGPEAKDLRAIEDDDPATLLAVPGAEAQFDALKGHAALPELDAFGRNLADVPILVRNAEGFSLRINKLLDDPDELKRLIEAGQRFAAILREG